MISYDPQKTFTPTKSPVLRKLILYMLELSLLPEIVLLSEMSNVWIIQI